MCCYQILLQHNLTGNKWQQENIDVLLENSLDSFADWKSVLAASPFVLLQLLFLEDIWPSTEVSVAKLDECIPEEKAPIFLSSFCCVLFFLTLFRGLTTVQSAPISRMAQTVWKNVQMAYRGQTVSFSSMLIKIESATRAIQTAPKGKQLCWPKTQSSACC